MSRNIYGYLVAFFLGTFLFLSYASLNPSFALTAGETCREGMRVSPTAPRCDTGLYCDTDKDTSGECQVGKVCIGVCRLQTCNPYGTAPNGGCQTNESCYIADPTTCRDQFCHGTCVSNTAPVGNQGDNCTTTTSNTQGSCKSGLVCQLQKNDPVGICEPPVATCNPELDSRTNKVANLLTIKCPDSHPCQEDHGQLPQAVCYSGGKAGYYCSMQCPNCTFSCISAADTQINCKCDNAAANGGSIGSGNNGFKCSTIINPNLQHSYCDSSSVGCYDDDPNATMVKPGFMNNLTLHGIKCSEPQISPPPPPCNHKTGGKCDHIDSSIGSLGTMPDTFIGKLFSMALAASGAIAIILIMRAGYQIMTARGNPEGIQQGRERLVAAIVGLMFLVFSFVILQVISTDILKIPNIP